MTAIGVFRFESEIYRLNETKREQCKMPNCISSEQSWDKSIHSVSTKFYDWHYKKNLREINDTFIV